MTKSRRIVRYFAMTAAVAFVSDFQNTMTMTWLARRGMEAVSAYARIVSPVLFLLASAITAALNRRYVFRSTLAWGVAIPVMVLLEYLFSALINRLWLPIVEAAMYAPSVLIGGALVSPVHAFSLARFVLWAALAYLFQRFVLYRETLDALDANEKENDE